MNTSFLSVRKDGYVAFYPSSRFLEALGRNAVSEIETDDDDAAVLGIRLTKARSGGCGVRDKLENERPRFDIPMRNFGKVMTNGVRRTEVTPKIDSSGRVCIKWPSEWKVKSR